MGSGNMSGPSLIFVLEELQRSKTDKDIGVMHVGLGPGLDARGLGHDGSSSEYM